MKPVNLIATLLFALVTILPASVVANGMDTVTIQSKSGDHVWQVELASDNESRSRGLMHRKSMPRDAGMLFRFSVSRPIAMWMKNTFIPLDMIFANQAGQVTHIHRGAVPQSLEVISSQGPARFVLEVNAGEADLYGVEIGDRLRHPWILPTN